MESLFSRILAIRKTGSKELRNRLIAELKDEAIKAARAYLGREPTGDEYSVALCAVNDAIDRYDQKKAGFLTFVSKMISYSLKEFFKNEKPKAICVSYDNTNIAILSDRKANEEYASKEQYEDLQDEIIRLRKILSNLGYTWDDVQQNRPSHQDSLNRLKSIALQIANLGFGERYIKENPLSRGLSRELKKSIGVDRRTLTKYRSYLCSLIVVLNYDFPIMRNYLRFRKESLEGGSQRDSS
jgi:RNA polymerase sigma-I factor